jgi:hypothetical protein
VLEGRVGIRIDADQGRRWLEVGPGDGVYLPDGVPHRYWAELERYFAGVEEAFERVTTPSGAPSPPERQPRAHADETATAIRASGHS